MLATISPSLEPALLPESRNLALDCFVSAIRNVSHYATDLEPELTEPHRKYLEELANRAATGTREALEESVASLRGLLREYRDKTSRYLNVLRGELGSTAAALQEILDTLGEADADPGAQLLTALKSLRDAPDSDIPTLRETVREAAATIENGLNAVRKQHQLAVSHFVIEIRMLHKRIDSLESAASIDMLTKLCAHKEIVARIRARQAPCRLLLIEANGIHTAEERFGGAVGEELTGAVIRRLRNNLPTSSAVGRWSDQGFVVILDLDSQDAGQLAARIMVNLAGSYACLKEGRTVRPPVQMRVELLESTGLGPDETLRQAANFFGE